MKIFTTCFVLFFASLANGTTTHVDEQLPGIHGPYLGQTPPGDTPEPFAPGIVATDGWEYGLTFMPNLKEAYFLQNNPDTDQHEQIQLREEGGIWYKSVFAPRRGQPVISADGKTMHLGRRYREWTNEGWSEIKLLEAPFDEMLIMRASSSMGGTLYFDTYVENNESFPIRYSRLVDGKREAPKALGPEINTGTYINHPFIAADESYLIFDVKREGGFGDSDIYISYRQKDGGWGKAINLGDKINTPAWEAAASVTPDGKYMFFNRTVSRGEDTDVDIYWVGAGFIDDLRP